MASVGSNGNPANPFTQLPKEIRLLVWEATFEPQYILLRFVEGRRLISNIPVYAFKPYDDPKSPTALQLCHESRTIALQRYRPWNFRWYLHDRVERSKVVMWDPLRDIVVLPKQFHKYQFEVLKVSCHFQLQILQNLAVPARFWLIDQSGRNSTSPLPALSKAFPNLEQLIICLGGKAERKAWDQPDQDSHLLFRHSPASHVSKKIDEGLDCIRRDNLVWSLSTIKVWEAEDDADMLYGEVFRVLVGEDMQPIYKCWCKPSRWDTSIHDRHDPKTLASAEDAPPPVTVWRRPRYGNRFHFTNRFAKGQVTSQQFKEEPSPS
ncbi:hypothetical protein N431DRAFT_326546 [Stipitochalara longipes BDJ]|nr:hypothetical protein N431DRAFT_326546 [Stipitochalara longipes BDJ]